MKFPTLALLLVLCAGAFESLALPRMDSTPAKRWGPSARAVQERGHWPSGYPKLERAAEIGKRDVILSDNRCPAMHTACGVSGPWSRNGFECIDTARDLESCGGCVTPLPGEMTATGVDCTSLEGVEDVACVRGSCQVYSCRDGYSPSHDGRHCRQVGKKGGLHQAASLHFE